MTSVDLYFFSFLEHIREFGPLEKGTVFERPSGRFRGSGREQV